MITATIHQAKTQFSHLLKRASEGEEIVIVKGRKATPIARLVAIAPVEKKPIGALEGRVSLGEAFWEPLPDEELRLWNGEGE
ncbi:MAG: type II toxin-antitoxin system Phd/YefM family antitoxin [Acidobacteriaceae bacterium]